MAKQYYSILTDYGTQAFAKAVGNKTPLPITHFAVGDGNGAKTTPTAEQSALVNEVYRAEISSITVDPRNNKQAIFELTIPENVGGFYIREMGIFDNQNKLVAIANCPESFKPTLESGSGKVQVLRMILIVSAADAVTITMNNAIYATQIQLKPKTITAESINRVDDEGHSHAIDRATTAQKGIVQLTNDTGLDSEELALTAKAGKKLAQWIAEIKLALGSYIKNERKSNRVDSDSQEDVATSLAVKKTYDLASNAIPNNKKSSAVNSPSADTVATSAAVKTVQDNANGRVLKAGDTMSGSLVIQGAKEGGFANGLILKNIFGGLGAGSFIDFFNGSNFPQASLHFTDRGSFSVGASVLTTPTGTGFDRDRREVHTNFNPDGRLWVKAYGWLHDFFLAASTFWDFVNKFQFYSVTGPTSVSRYVKIPCKDGKGVKISFGHTNVNASWQDFNLAEDFGSFLIAIGVDRGPGRLPIGMEVLNNKTVRIHTGGPAGVNFLFVGEYNH